MDAETGQDEIKDWADWFKLCGDAVRPAGDYESLIRKYYALIEGGRGARFVYDDYAQKHRMGFWHDGRPIPTRIFTQGAVAAGVALLVGLFVPILLYSAGFLGGMAETVVSAGPVDAVRGALVRALSTLLGVGDAIAYAGPLDMLRAAVPGALRLCALAFVVRVAVFVAHRLSITCRMAALERRLAHPLSFVPPSYRNAYCLSAISELYRSYGVGTMSAALDACDRYVEGNAATYVPVLLMYDLAFNGEGKREVRLASEDDGNFEPDTSDPALPPDISTKVRQGPADPDRELASLIAMDNVKDQIRQLRNRLEFSGGKASMGGNNLCFMGPAGVGKALDDDTEIAVADGRGFVRIADLVRGDRVFDECGRPTRVLGTYPQGELDCYRVTLFDGMSLVANDEHIFSARREGEDAFHDVTVREMMDAGGTWVVPCASTLVRDERTLPVDPYALGAIIAHGRLEGGTLRVDSLDRAAVAAVAHALHATAEPDGYTWSFSRGGRRLRLASVLADPMFAGTVRGTDARTVSIPDAYLTASAEQRWQLVRGLMDFGGTTRQGTVPALCYVTRSAALADDLVTLVTSLGTRCHAHHGEDGRHVVHVKAPADGWDRFFCEGGRKIGEVADGSCSGFDEIPIRSIEPMGERRSMTCIYVDSPSHLFLAGRAHVVTHNTVVARIVCGLLYEMGYIQHNRIVEVDGNYLKSPYQGQSGARTQAIINYARGGVLFIDEAYLLAAGGGGADAEATGVLLKAMEDMRDELVVILAGYEDPMTRLLSSNEGFRSRIRHTITFKPYTPDELMLIIDKFMRDSEAMRDMTLSPEARSLVRDELRRESTRPSFGNARDARNAIDRLYDIHADRVVRGEEPARMTITEADARKWLAEQADKAADASRQFMAENNIDSSIISVEELRGRTHMGSKNPRHDLDEMIGLADVKRQIADLEAQVRFYADDPDSRGRGLGNISLEGPAGAGKTVTVSIITGLLYEMGYIQRDQYVDISGDFLRGSYLGQTGKRTEATISYALGGVLFIDEAYLLASGENGQADQFGAEAVGVLVNAMEKHQEDLVVILAGYPEDMAHLYDVNPGLRSRIGTVIRFPSYSPKEICKIFQLMCAKQGFSVDRDVWMPLAAAAGEAARDPHFGNGRWARQLMTTAIRVHARRYAGDPASGVPGLPPERKRVLDQADVAEALRSI